MLIDMTTHGDHISHLTDAVRLCETAKNSLVIIIAQDKEGINSVLNILYDLVKNSSYTVSEFVRAKQYQISFINGSHIDVETANYKYIPQFP